MKHITPIYTKRKLEKTIGEFMSVPQFDAEEHFGAWNATLFYISKKKCWVLSHKQTCYVLLLPDKKKKDVIILSTILEDKQ